MVTRWSVLIGETPVQYCSNLYKGGTYSYITFNEARDDAFWSAGVVFELHLIVYDESVRLHEKFPWLGDGQLGDVLITTKTRLFLL